MKRGEIYYAELSPVYGSEQGGLRPVLVVQNNTGNRYSATTIVAPLVLAENEKSNLPAHVKVDLEGATNVVLLEHVRGISRNRLISKVGELHWNDMKKVDRALKVSVGLVNGYQKVEGELPTVRRGGVYYAELSPVFGSEQGGVRPVLVVQNNVGNMYGATTIIAPLTTRAKVDLPTHVSLKLDDVSNIILLEQVRGISRTRLISWMGDLSEDIMEKVDDALKVSLGLD